MRLYDLQNLDINDITSWPLWFKAVGTVVVSVAILFAGYWFVVRGQVETLQKRQSEEQTLRDQYLEKKALAINLPAYLEQMEKIKESFSVMLHQLPDSTEVSELLTDITQAGLARGLEFNLFKPQNIRQAEFYAVLPINIAVKGSFHQLGEFVSDLAALPRIVTLGDITISAGQQDNQLTMSAIARAYHYLDETETEAEP